jgi:hypothetical protein
MTNSSIKICKNADQCEAFSFLRLFAVGIVFLLCALTARAELEWEQKTIQLDLHPLQVTGAVSFPFKNGGTNAVEILSVRTACGCLNASFENRAVALDGAGCIDVRFDFRDKTGPQRKGVAVRASGLKPTVLYVQVNIQEVYSLSIDRLEWTASADPEPKRCRLVNQTKVPVRLVSAESSIDAFSVELVSIREGFEYDVVVRPHCRASAAKSTIRIQTECPPEITESRVYTLPAVLR